MPDSHAILSPSSSSRWIACPASVLLSQQVSRPKESTSSAAAEGTMAHELAEIEASFAFGKIDRSKHSQWLFDWRHRSGLNDQQYLEMREHVQTYVDLLTERMAIYPNSYLMLEQSLPSGIEGCWGTSDAVIVSPVHVEAIDFKYGRGIAVSAVNNSQLRLYGLGALDEYGDVMGETENVALTICQPRNGGNSTEIITADELRAWREKIRPIAEAALKPGAEFGPSADTCRFCPVAGECKPRMEHAMQLDFGPEPAAWNPNLLTPEELAAALAMLPAMRSWGDAVADTALHMAYSEGVHVPGYKVVMSGGRRVITDGSAAIQTLIDQGYTAEQVASISIKGIGALERLVGKGNLEKALGPKLITKSEGKPAVVPEDDPRPSVSPHSEAIATFTKEPAA